MIPTLRTLALVAAVCAVLAGAVGAVAASLGAFHPWLDLAAHFAPVWLALILCGLVLGLTVRRRRRARTLLTAPAVTGLLGLTAIMGPEFAAALANGQAGATADDFRVLQFNTWAANADPEHSAAIAQAADPDVIVMEETVGPGEAVFDRLRRSHPYGPSSRSIGHTRILSRRPGRYDAVYDDGLWVNQFRTTTRDGRSVTVLGVHLVWPDPVNEQARQRAALARIVAQEPGEVILAGDFNLTPWSAGMRQQDRYLEAIGLERRTRATFSWPARLSPRLLAPFPVLPIDHVYAPRSWATVEVRRLPRTGSDHYPVLVVLRPPSRPAP